MQMVLTPSCTHAMLEGLEAVPPHPIRGAGDLRLHPLVQWGLIEDQKLHPQFTRD